MKKKEEDPLNLKRRRKSLKKRRKKRNVNQKKREKGDMTVMMKMKGLLKGVDMIALLQLVLLTGGGMIVTMRNRTKVLVNQAGNMNMTKETKRSITKIMIKDTEIMIMIVIDHTEEVEITVIMIDTARIGIINIEINV